MQNIGGGICAHTTGNFLGSIDGGPRPPQFTCPEFIGRGNWVGTPGTYAECDVVYHSNEDSTHHYFIANADHGVVPESEPGVGADWEMFWTEVGLLNPDAGSWASTTNITVQANVGDTQPITTRVYLQSRWDDGQSSAWSLSEAPERVAFTVSKTSGQGPMDWVDVTMDPSGLLEGITTAILQFNNIGSSDTPITIDLRLEMLPVGEFIRTEAGDYLLTEGSDRTKTETSS
jgi:hypothetical protein